MLENVSASLSLSLYNSWKRDSNKCLQQWEHDHVEEKSTSQDFSGKVNHHPGSLGSLTLSFNTQNVGCWAAAKVHLWFGSPSGMSERHSAVESLRNSFSCLRIWSCWDDCIFFHYLLNYFKVVKLNPLLIAFWLGNWDSLSGHCKLTFVHSKNLFLLL